MTSLVSPGRSQDATRRRLGAAAPASKRYSAPFVRDDAGADGNLEGLHHKGITLGDEWVYRNPFAPARLSDDEIAVASCPAGMADYLAGGPDICSLADAAQDAYLAPCVEEAVATGRPVRTNGHVWDE